MKNLSQAILSSASNLLGICFLLVSYITKISGNQNTYLDECLILPIISFFVACILSYMALRTRNPERAEHYERYGDFAFILGLSSIAVVAVAFTFELIT